MSNQTNSTPIKITSSAGTAYDLLASLSVLSAPKKSAGPWDVGVWDVRNAQYGVPDDACRRRRAWPGATARTTSRAACGGRLLRHLQVHQDGHSRAARSELPRNRAF